MNTTNEPPKEDTSINSLEAPTTVVRPSTTDATGGSIETHPAGYTTPTDSGSPNQPRQASGIRAIYQRFSIYLLAFILLLVVCGIGAAVLYLRDESATSSLPSQPLSQSTLDQLANNDVSVGEPKHTLSVQGNTVFSGNILTRGNLQVAGTLQVGSDLTLNGIRVSGNSTFDDVQVTKSLAITGNEAIQGQLNVQQNLSVNGSGTFRGAISAPSLTVGSLQLSGELAITHHITAGGSTPLRSNGAALGSGGTATVSGSDTGGSVTINTGTSPTSGCFLTITFTSKFNSIPHIVITPVGSAAAGLGYYINRSTSNFSICTTTAAPASTTFGFDYIAFD